VVGWLFFFFSEKLYWLREEEYRHCRLLKIASIFSCRHHLTLSGLFWQASPFCG